MSLHNIESEVEKTISKYCDSEYVTPEQLKSILSESLYKILDSRDFERHIRGIQ